MCYQTGVGDKVAEGSQEPAQGSPEDVRPISFIILIN